MRLLSAPMIASAQVSLGLLQLQHFFLDGIAGNQTIRKNLAFLTDAVRAVHSLRLNRGVPPGIEK